MVPLTRCVGLVFWLNVTSCLSLEVPGFFLLKWKCYILIGTIIISFFSWRVTLSNVVK